MITIDAGEDSKPRGARKGTLTKKFVAELRVRIERALREHGRRLGPSAVNFLHCILTQLNVPAGRLSKRQVDITDEILLQAAFGEPLVILEGNALTDLERLFRHATGDSRISSYEVIVIARLKYKAYEPAIAVTQGVWRTLETIKHKTRFDLPGEPPPIDIDGVVENDDPDGLPSDRSEIEANQARDWLLSASFTTRIHRRTGRPKPSLRPVIQLCVSSGLELNCTAWAVTTRDPFETRCFTLRATGLIRGLAPALTQPGYGRRFPKGRVQPWGSGAVLYWMLTMVS
jgi:hypothetical protein